MEALGGFRDLGAENGKAVFLRLREKVPLHSFLLARWLLGPGENHVTETASGRSDRHTVAEPHRIVRDGLVFSHKQGTKC